MPRRMPSSRGVIPADFTKFTAQSGEPWTISEEDFLLASVDWCLEHGVQFSNVRFEILQAHSTRELKESLVRNKLHALVLSLRSSHGNLKTLMAEGSTILDLSKTRKKNMQCWFAFIDAKYYYLKPPKPAPVSPVAPIAPVAEPCHSHSSSGEVQDEAEIVEQHLQLVHEDIVPDSSDTAESQEAPEPSVDTAVPRDRILVQSTIQHGPHEQNYSKPSRLVNVEAKQNTNIGFSFPVFSKKTHESQTFASVPITRSIRAETPVPLPPIPGKRNGPTQLHYLPLSSHSEVCPSPKSRCKDSSEQATGKSVLPTSSTKGKSSNVTAAPVSGPTLLDLSNEVNSENTFPALQSLKFGPMFPASRNNASSTVAEPVAATTSPACAKSPSKVSRSNEEAPTFFPISPSLKQNNSVVSSTDASNPFRLRYFGVPDSVKEPNWKAMFHQERKLRMELNHLFHNKFPRTRTETVKEFGVLSSRIKNLSLLICALKTGITPQSILRCPKGHGKLMHKCIQRVAGCNPVVQVQLSLDKDVQSYELLSALIMAAIFETIIQPAISVLFTPPDDLALCYREIYLEECGVTGLDEMDFLCFWRYIQKPKFRNIILPKKVYQLRNVFIKALGGLLPRNSAAKAAEGSLEEREVIDELDRVLSLALDIKLAVSLYMESFHFHFFEHSDEFDPIYMKSTRRHLDEPATAPVKLCLSPVMFKATQNETEGTEYDLLSPDSLLPFNRAIRVTMNGDDFSKYAKALEAVVVL